MITLLKTQKKVYDDEREKAAQNDFKIIFTKLIQRWLQLNLYKKSLEKNSYSNNFLSHFTVFKLGSI